MLRQVFKDNGGEAETADAALTALNTRLGNLANTAAGPAAAAMKTLGIGFASITSLSPDEKFDVIAKKLAGISDPARRAGLAADLFGKTAGPELAGLLGQSNQVIDQTHQKMVDLGSLMGNTTVAQGAKLDAAFPGVDVQMAHELRIEHRHDRGQIVGVGRRVPRRQSADEPHYSAG
ncbi:MAG: hypothetical protein WDM84_08055 [Bauldia sp.]